MILFPVAIFPLIGFGSAKFAMMQAKKMQAKTSSVVWIGEANVKYLADRIGEIPGIDLMNQKLDSTQAAELLDEKSIEVFVIVPADFQARLDDITEGKADVTVPQIRIYLKDSRTQSQRVRSKIVAMLSQVRQEITTTYMQANQIPIELINPFTIESHNIASRKEMGGMVIGSFLPYVIILMSLTGAMYPAIDLTAGEKERGTLETLLVAGVDRIDIVIGKFLTVFTTSVVTVTLTICSMAVSGYVALKQVPEFGQAVDLSLGLFEVMIMILAMIPLSAIFSSLLMTLSLFAKSYREAQTYISPLMFIVIIPAMSSLMPDTEASQTMAFIPIANVSIMLKDGLSGSFDLGISAITMGVNLLLAVGGLMLVLRMFKKESVLFKV
jgi:sodium transport system permease protein